MTEEIKFNFGNNWKDYSNSVLMESNLKEAVDSLDNLVGKDLISNKTFLDIGCGSGLFSIAAVKLGAKTVLGFDLSKESVDVSKQNTKRFLGEEADIKFFQRSVFECTPDNIGKFDIVYSWGVLHHTGDMWSAILNSMNLVEDKGLLVIAIYNRHWSSPIWKRIKYIYNISPLFLQKIMIFVFYFIIIVTKFLVTFKNPLKLKRGMKFYYNVIDWVGGYPYEYATQEEIIQFCKNKNFNLIKTVKAGVPTGCNEFVFQKR